MRAEGVTVLELYRGVGSALEGTNLRPRIVRGKSLGIAAPFLAVVRRPAGEHCVVVLEVQPDAIFIGDPARGRFAMTQEQFIEEWTGVAVAIEPRARASD